MRLLSETGEKNELAVRLENEPPNHHVGIPGPVLYRNVHLVINEDAHILRHGDVCHHSRGDRQIGKSVFENFFLVSPEGANMIITVL